MVASKESWANLPCIGCMPEPYYGKIDSNSVAILNLHPAFHGNDLSNLNRTIMAPLVGGNYAKYAKAFPLFKIDSITLNNILQDFFLLFSVGEVFLIRKRPFVCLEHSLKQIVFFLIVFYPKLFL